MADTNTIIGAIENAVEADDNAAVMTLATQLDSQIDDKEREILRTKNDFFGEFLRNKAAQPIEGESEDERSRRLYGSLGGDDEEAGWVPRARSLLAGSALELGDEMVASGAALANILAQKDPGKSYTELYNMYVPRERRKARKFMQENPGADISFKVGGALTSPLWRVLGQLGARAIAPLGKVGDVLRVTSPASYLGATREGIKAGAYGGFLYGLGMGEDDLESRLESGGEMAAYGGVGGGLLGPVLRGAVDAIKAGMTWSQARKTGMSRAVFDEASAIIAADEAVVGGGATRIARMGDDAMLADAGLAAQKRLDQIIETGGPGAAQARDAVLQRGERVGAELAKELDTVLGPLQGVKTRHQIRHSRKSPDKLYEAAYNTPINYSAAYGQRILGLLQRLPAVAVTKANELIRTDSSMMGKRVGQIVIKVADDGTINFEKLPDLRQIDYITRVLGDVPGTTRTEAGSIMPKVSQLGRNIFNTSREIRDLLKDNIPAYRDALKIAAMNMKEGDAVRLGSVMLKPSMTRQEFFSTIEDLGQRELDFVKQGLRTHIDDVMARVTRAMKDPLTDENVMKEFIRVARDLSSRDAREKMKLLLGDEAQQIFRRLDVVEQGIQLQAQLHQGSKTYALQEAKGRGKAYAESAFKTILSGDLAKGVGKLVSPLVGGDPAAALAAEQAINARMAEALTRRISQPPVGPPSEFAVHASRLPQQRAQIDRATATATNLLGPLRARAGAGIAETRAAENEQQRRRMIAAALGS
jgi:hypothetical protein